MFYKNLKRDYKDFINARREIFYLKKDLRFWESTCHKLLAKYNTSTASDLALIKIKNKFSKTER